MKFDEGRVPIGNYTFKATGEKKCLRRSKLAYLSLNKLRLLLRSHTQTNTKIATTKLVSIDSFSDNLHKNLHGLITRFASHCLFSLNYFFYLVLSRQVFVNNSHSEKHLKIRQLPEMKPQY